MINLDIDYTIDDDFDIEIIEDTSLGYQTLYNRESEYDAVPMTALSNREDDGF